MNQLIDQSFLSKDHIQKYNSSVFTRLTNFIQDSNLVMGTDTLDIEDYFIYDSNTQTLYYDADGSAFGAKVEFVQVVIINSLSSADFSVI